MSNAKRRHRRRWYRAQRWARVALIEADLQLRGYSLDGCTGAERIWSRVLSTAELKEMHPFLQRLHTLPAFAREVQWVEVP